MDSPAGCSLAQGAARRARRTARPDAHATSPASPADDNSPEILGTAAAGSVVRIYTNAGCTGEPVALGSAEMLASSGITANVANNTTTFFYASASDGVFTSPCSTTFALYTHRLSPPPAPVFSDSDPDSPANQHEPFIKGSAVAGGLVRLYTTPSCTGPRVAENYAAAFAAPGLQPFVFNDATTTFYATVTDAAGTTSACSTSSLTYVEDSTPPETTIVSGPAATVPAGSAVRFGFSSSEPGAAGRREQRKPGARRLRRFEPAARCTSRRSSAAPARTRSAARRGPTSSSGAPATTGCAVSPATTACMARPAATACAAAAARIASSADRVPTGSKARAATTA